LRKGVGNANISKLDADILWRHAMKIRPVDPKTHGAIDYVFAVWQFFAPPVLGLQGRSLFLSRVFGLFQGTVNALTDHPLAVK